ncbi:MAG: BON domain-containing protein [Acidobacteriota bacterium]
MFTNLSTQFGSSACPQWGSQFIGGLGNLQSLYPPFISGFAPFVPGMTPFTFNLGAVTSDEEIEQLLYNFIDSNLILQLAEITVEVRDRVVTLNGNVPNKQIKFIVENLAYQLPVVIDVNNQLKITARRTRRREQTETATAQTAKGRS